MSAEAASTGRASWAGSYGEDMEASAIISFPRPATDPAVDAAAASVPDAEAVDQAIAEIDAAIALVSAGAARRVRLTAIPFLEAAAATGLARATAASMQFAFERGDRSGVATVTVGPIE